MDENLIKQIEGEIAEYRDIQRNLKENPVNFLLSNALRVLTTEQQVRLVDQLADRCGYKDRWIKIGDRLPENEQIVLFIHEDGWQDVGKFNRIVLNRRNVFVTNAVCYKATHWQPLPERPQN